MSSIKNRDIGSFFAIIAAAVAFVGLFLYGIYVWNGGTMNALVVAALIIGILFELSLLALNGDISDVAAILAPVLLVCGAGLELGDGIGNLTDWASGIICFGNPDLAESNLAITSVLMISVLIAIIACFMHKGAKQRPYER